MADPRELARQAFGMLQNALASSEARTAQLTEELARKPVPKDKLENQVSVLGHRLESVEEECARWRREAEQLEEVLANERVKFDALKKKLEIAESGPDKLTKKEINYWRANAEKVEEQINAYKSRIAALKRELREKDLLLVAGHPALPPAEIASPDQGDVQDALVFAEAEAASLRQQIAGLNAVIADAHAVRERLESELADMRARLEHADQQIASHAPAPTGDTSVLQSDLERAQQDSGRLRASLQMSEAELHELRRARGDLANELATLKRQMDDERASMQASEAELHELRRTRGKLENELTALKHQIDGERSSNADHERQHQLLTAQLGEARARETSLHAELDAARQELTSREQQLPAGAVPGTVADELKSELARTQQETADLRAALTRSSEELAQLRDAREALAAELAELQRRIDEETANAEARTQREQAVAAELKDTQDREAQLRSELDERQRASLGHEEAAQALHDAVAAAQHKAAEAETQLADLRAELKEEKEYSENLSELANSRQDQVIKLQDSVEEARERLDDALWRLDKAKHFERLVARRKGLIASLIEALRGKNKAMVALKAGIDSLRTHKAMVEETQQKLLVRMEALKNELGAARERLKRLEVEAAAASQKNVEETDRTQSTGLQERLTTQAEIIQSLENELKAAKAFKRDAEEKDSEVGQLHEELETKNSIIARLQSDLDDQQRKLAKLRGSDSETMRLRAVSEKDRSKIDILERENAELRAMIESAEHARSEGGSLSDTRELELQAKIAELTEAVGKWKKKYEFLATEAPPAYQAQTAAKQ
jgi:chromosome segregation ATPase